MNTKPIPVNNNFSIIAMNCVGGVVYHDFNCKFLSSTINVCFNAEDFVDFCKNLDDYLGKRLIFIETSKPYPVAKLDKITINFVHYNSNEEAQEKWIERCARINFDNLFFIMCENSDCNIDLMRRFDCLPYENKVIFTHKKVIILNRHIKLMTMKIKTRLVMLLTFKNLDSKYIMINLIFVNGYR